VNLTVNLGFNGKSNTTVTYYDVTVFYVVFGPILRILISYWQGDICLEQFCCLYWMHYSNSLCVRIHIL